MLLFSSECLLSIFPVIDNSTVCVHARAHTTHTQLPIYLNLTDVELDDQP
jgi:hypothetical protein